MTWTTRRRSDLGTLAAIRAGTGPLVVLIHGVGLRAEAWGAQIDTLSRDFAVMAVDMPGHGHSAPLPAGATLTDYTDAIATCLDRPAVVIGHSMGAMIALDLAIRHPDKVRGVAALNAIYDRSEAARRAVQTRAEALDGRSMAGPTQTLGRWFGTEDTPERAACHSWLTQVDPMGYRTAYGVFARENGPDADDLATLRCPALFLTGSDEPNSTPAMSQAMAALTPHGTAHIIDGAAHMMPMTHATKVNAALLAFVWACTP